MKLSMVIPACIVTKELEEFTVRALDSYRDHVDELICVSDGGMYSSEVMRLCDLYLWRPTNRGFTYTVNQGWKNASGDFVALVNNDTYLMSGDLDELCIPGKVTSPHIVNQYIDFLAGPFWVVPKEITEKRGYLLEQMKTYSSDSEYDLRVRDIFQKVPSIKIYHEQAKTVTALGIEGGEEQERDRRIYEKLQREGKAV